MAQCPNCGATSAEGSGFCPACGTSLAAPPPGHWATPSGQIPPSNPAQPSYPAPQPPKKKGGCLKWGLIAVGIVVVLAIIASAVGGDDKASPPATTSASVATTSASAATTSASVSQDTVGTTAPTDPPIEAFSLGETAEMETLQITVNSAHWDKGSDFSKPDAGTRWLVIDCTLKNNGTESENISSLLMFKLTDQDSYTRDMQMFADTKGSLDGELAAGASMRGQIAFDVDEGQENWKFVFEPNVFGTGQLIFDISSSDVQ